MADPQKHDCQHLVEYFRETNTPREGDGEVECEKCGRVMALCRNKETVREAREREAAQGPTMQRRCTTCGWVGQMSVEEGPNLIRDWRIATCTPCGQRQDVFGNE